MFEIFVDESIANSINKKRNNDSQILFNFEDGASPFDDVDDVQMATQFTIIIVDYQANILPFFDDVVMTNMGEWKIKAYSKSLFDENMRLSPKPFGGITFKSDNFVIADDVTIKLM